MKLESEGHKTNLMVSEENMNIEGHKNRDSNTGI